MNTGVAGGLARPPSRSSSGTNYGQPGTIIDAAVGTAANIMNGRIYASRAHGYGLISKIRLRVGTQNGNVCVGVYDDLNGQPGNLKGHCGIYPTPAGVFDVPLLSSVQVNEGDWFALQSDSSTASFYSVGDGGVATLFQGMTGWTTVGFNVLPLPSSLTLTNWETKVYIMFGVA